MIISKRGDVMIFYCPDCGCVFREAVKKTGLAHAGVWDPDKQEHGTWMDCPDCGTAVLGFRRNKIEKSDMEHRDRPESV